MKVTKYPQSCLLIEIKGKTLLIDPGAINWDDSFIDDFKDVDYIFITHRHGDHLYADAVKKILGFNKAKLYSSSEVAKFFPDLPINIVKDGDIVDFGDFKVEVVKAVHGFIPPFKAGKQIYENIGFIIDDGVVRFYATSDTICFEHEYKCDAIALPVCGHGIVMGPFEASLFSKDTSAKLTIPTHYDNPIFPIGLDEVEKTMKEQEITYKILSVRESIEI